MAKTEEIKIILKADDQASPKIKGASSAFLSLSQSIVGGFAGGAVFAAITEGFKQIADFAVKALGAVKNFSEESIKSFQNFQAATKGLASIVEGKLGKESLPEATRAAKELASDGLLSISEASTGLKNLLLRGFGLKESIELMNRFKNSAAFGRQSSLEFGQAVVSATEGLKNQNPILVDNAGVTKNMSKMWEDYAKKLGKSVANLTDAEKIQAEYNGILEETRFQMGDVNKLMEGSAGSQAKLSAAMENLRIIVGQALDPAFKKLIETFTPLVSQFATFAQEHLPVIIDKVNTFVTSVKEALTPEITALLDKFASLGDSALKAWNTITTNEAVKQALKNLAVEGLNQLILSLGLVVELVTKFFNWVSEHPQEVAKTIQYFTQVLQIVGGIVQFLIKAIGLFNQIGRNIGGFLTSPSKVEGGTNVQKQQQNLNPANLLGRQHGGVHEGRPGDADSIRISDGEMVLNKAQQVNLFKMIKNGSTGKGGNTINIGVNIPFYSSDAGSKRKVAEEIYNELKRIMATNGDNFLT